MTSYLYDGLGRLTQEAETNGLTVNYTYDAAGNRSQMAVTGTETYTTNYTYDANNRLLTETKTENNEAVITTYTYDANGNTLAKSTPAHGEENASSTVYSYNGFNQLVGLTIDGTTVAYAYNAQGIRTAKRVKHLRTAFLLDGGNVIAEVQSNTVTDSYLRGVNLVRRESNSETEYYLFNAHGDVVTTTNLNGTVNQQYDYDAFGNEKAPDALDTNPFRYCGEYLDTETGDYYLRARYYNPETSRLRSEDPIKDGLNWYTYCYNNPVMFYDPSGLKTIALRSTIEGLGGKVTWNNQTKTATIYLDGQSVKVYAGDENGSYIASNGKMYTDDAWLFIALSSTFDLGKGWKGRIERGTSGKDYQRHVHIYKGDKAWSQNEDGSPHDDGNNSAGSPPNSVLKSLKKQKSWDWKKKEKDWLNKIEISTDPAGYYFISYPNGRTVTVYKPAGYSFIPYSPSTQNLRDYYYGPIYIDLSGTGTATNPSIPFLPIPSPVPIPVPTPIPMPFPAF